MILYNISVMVEDSRHQQVLNWLKTYLNEITFETRFLKMLDSPHEGSTYCIQFIAKDEQEILLFQNQVTATLQTYLGQHHAEKAFIFDSKMQYLSLQTEETD